MASSRLVVVFVFLLGACTLTAGPSDSDPPPDASAPVDDVDAASPADDPDAAPLTTTCVGDDHLVCDGFESGTLADWQTDISGGSLEIVDSPVFLGQSAVRMQTIAAGSVAQISRSHPAQTSGTLYTRFYLYMPSSLITGGLAELSNAGDGSGIHYHFGINGNDPSILVNDINEVSATPVARDTWVCIEMALDIGANGGGELFVNGTSVASVTGQDTAVPGGYDDAFFGLHYTADADGALDVYMDEIAIDDEPIGCL